MARGVAASGSDELSRLLVSIRRASGMGQTAAGEAAARYLGHPLTQAKLSRAERGRIPLSPEEADAVAQACDATADDRRRVVELSEERADGRVLSRTALMRDGVEAQRRTLRLEQDASLIRSWQDSIVIGSVQSRAYTEAALAGSPFTAEWWAARDARIALLRDPGRRWELFMSEAALRWGIGAEVMADQADHLAELSLLPTVELGVVPFGPNLPIPCPRPFHMYDQQTVALSTDSGTAFLTDPVDMTRYATTFRSVGRLALRGDDLRRWLVRLAEEYRR